MQDLLQNKKFKWLLAALGSLAVLLLIFQLGVYVGYRKANFSFRWGENYHRNFGGPREGFLRDLPGGDFFSGHGTAGVIVEVEKSSVVIKGDDNIEKVINISAGTLVRMGQSNLAVSDLKSGQSVVVVGTPKEDGTIDAKIIRVFDPSTQPPGPPPGPKNMGPQSFNK